MARHISNHQQVACHVLHDSRRAITRTRHINSSPAAKVVGAISKAISEFKLWNRFYQKPDNQFETSIPQVVNKSVQAMSASTLSTFVGVFLRARDTGALTFGQTATAVPASMLLAAFAKTDNKQQSMEATGYQYDRASRCLEDETQAVPRRGNQAVEKNIP